MAKTGTYTCRLLTGVSGLTLIMAAATAQANAMNFDAEDAFDRNIASFAENIENTGNNIPDEKLDINNNDGLKGRFKDFSDPNNAEIDEKTDEGGRIVLDADGDLAFQFNDDEYDSVDHWDAFFEQDPINVYGENDARAMVGIQVPDGGSVDLSADESSAIDVGSDGEDDDASFLGLWNNSGDAVLNLKSAEDGGDGDPGSGTDGGDGGEGGERGIGGAGGSIAIESNAELAFWKNTDVDIDLSGGDGGEAGVGGDGFQFGGQGDGGDGGDGNDGGDGGRITTANDAAMVFRRNEDVNIDLFGGDGGKGGEGGDGGNVGGGEGGDGGKGGDGGSIATDTEADLAFWQNEDVDIDLSGGNGGVGGVGESGNDGEDGGDGGKGGDGGSIMATNDAAMAFRDNEGVDIDISGGKGGDGESGDGGGSDGDDGGDGGAISLDGALMGFWDNDAGVTIDVSGTDGSDGGTIALNDGSVLAVSGSRGTSPLTIAVVEEATLAFGEDSVFLVEDSTFSVDLDDQSEIAIADRSAWLLDDSEAHIDNDWKDVLQGAEDGTGVAVRGAGIDVDGDGNLTIDPTGNATDPQFLVTASAEADSDDEPGLAPSGEMGIGDGLHSFVGLKQGQEPTDAEQPVLEVENGLNAGDNTQTSIRDGEIAVVGGNNGDDATAIFGDNAHLFAWDDGAFAVTADDDGDAELILDDAATIALWDGGGIDVQSHQDGSGVMHTGMESRIWASGADTGLSASDEIIFQQGTQAAFERGSALNSAEVIVEPDSALHLRNYDDNQARWEVDDLTIEGGSGGTLDVGRTDLTLIDAQDEVTDTTLTLTGASNPESSGGQLVVELYLDDDNELDTGSVTTDIAKIEDGARLKVSQSDLSVRDLWENLDGGLESKVVIAEDGEGSDIDPIEDDNIQGPDARLVSFKTDVRSDNPDSLMLLGSQADPTGVADDLDLSDPAKAAFTAVMTNAPDYGDDIFDFLNLGDDRDLEILAEQVTADATGAAPSAAFQALTFAQSSIDNRMTTTSGPGAQIGSDTDDPPLYAFAGDPQTIETASEDETSPLAGVWARFSGSQIDQGRRDGVNGFDMNEIGFTLGVDGQITDETMFGLAFTYSEANVDFSGERRGNDLDVASYVGTVYGRYQGTDQPWLVDWQAALGHHDYEERRVLTGFADTQEADYSSTSLMGRISGGYEFDLAEAATFTPFGRFTASRVSTDSFRFGPDLEREENPDSVRRLEPEIGARIEGDFDWTANTFVRSHAAASVGYDLANDENSGDLTFMDTGQTVSIPGVTQSPTTLRINTGIDIVNRAGLSLSANYDGTFRSDFQSHTGSLRARYEF